jgi:hypothetical protein
MGFNSGLKVLIIIIIIIIIKNDNDLNEMPCYWRFICTSIFKFYKYWPDDGLFRPKLVTNI